MGGRAGGGALGGGGGRDAFYDHPIGRQMLEKALSFTLSTPAFSYQIKDPQVKAELEQAVRQYAKEVGFTDGMYVQLGTLPKGKYAMVQGDTITLSKAIYGRKYQTVKAYFDERIAKGWTTATGKPVAKTLVHEFAHRTYHGLSASGKAQVAAAYKSFMGSKSKKGWGIYAGKSVEEFYADGMAKGLLGKSDAWTKAIRKAK